jgi:hypothetical protein
MPTPAICTRVDSALLKALARPLRYHRMLDDGQCASITEMIKAERLDRGYMGRLLQLTLLDPSIMKTVLDGHHCRQLDPPSMVKTFSVGWKAQDLALT